MHNFKLPPEERRERSDAYTKDDDRKLVALREPVNKFPDFVGESVRQLKTLCPFLGKHKIAAILARAGPPLGVTTVGRVLKQQPPPPATLEIETPTADSTETKAPSRKRAITSKQPNHVWLVDLTTVPILSGMWTTWLPFALPQIWPFCWWLVVLMDHKSRMVLKVRVLTRQPDSQAIRQVIQSAIQSCGQAPKYLVCDQGPQFTGDRFRRWLKRKKIKPRYGAVGQYGSIAICERLIWSIKYEWLQELDIPARLADFQSYLDNSLRWHNAFRPHMALHGKTPNEAYHCRSPANQRPRIEPRENWPRKSRCALPFAKIKDKWGRRFSLHVRRYAGQTNMPVVTLRRAA